METCGGYMGFGMDFAQIGRQGKKGTIQASFSSQKRNNSIKRAVLATTPSIVLSPEN